MYSEEHRVDNLGAGLRALDNRIMRYMEQRFRAIDRDMVTGTNGWILAYLLENAHRDVYQRELEQEFGVTRSTVSKVITLMEQKGLVERCLDEHDARQRRLRLTKDAMIITRELDTEGKRLNERLLRGFDANEIEKLQDYMNRMMRNMQEEGD